ncbi:MAG: Gfo/Idh/MocA family oxidoreductase [Phycisphaerae bacterium]
MIHIGVIGAGAWGVNLIRNVASNPLTRLAAVCDPDEAACRRVAETYRAPSASEGSFSGTVIVPELGDLLGQPGLDAIIVASPPHLHYAHAKAALQAGYHVLVEKPLCTNAEDAADLVETAEQNDLRLMAGHTFVYNNLVGEVKRRIVAGDLGEIRYVYSQRLNLGRVRNDVDALWNLAPHDISITNYLLEGRPRTVNARGVSYVQTSRNIADVAFFQMDYSGGRLMHGHVSWLDPQKVRRIVVVGSERMLVYDDMDSARHIQVFDKRVEVDFRSPMQDFADFKTRVRAGDLVIPNIGLKEPLAALITHFAQCVGEGRRPLTDGRSGLELLCILEALTRSMDQGGGMTEVDYTPLGLRTARTELTSA